MKIRCLVLFAVLLPNMVSAADLFIATSGDDTNPGTKAKPFATLNRARAETRKFKEQGVTVWLREGTYCFEQSFELNQADGGAENRPVAYRAFQNETVRLAGGHQISASDFKPVTDPFSTASMNRRETRCFKSISRPWESQISAGSRMFIEETLPFWNSSSTANRCR